MREPDATAPKTYVKALGVDFDGVLHDRRTTSPVPDGKPIEGAIEALPLLMLTYAVFVHTARMPEPVVQWLGNHGLPAIADDQPGRQYWSEQGVLLVTRQKLVAVAYIDDRAIPFRSWPQALSEVGKLY